MQRERNELLALCRDLFEQNRLGCACRKTFERKHIEALSEILALVYESFNVRLAKFNSEADHGLADQFHAACLAIAVSQQLEGHVEPVVAKVDSETRHLYLKIVL